MDKLPFLCFADIQRILYKNILTITLISILFSCICLTWLFIQDVEYESSSRYLSKSEEDSSLKSLSHLLKPSSAKQEYISYILRSRKLLYRLIDKLQLQASISENRKQSKLWKNMKENSMVFYANYANIYPLSTILKDPQVGVLCHYDSYELEDIERYDLRFISETEFSIQNKDSLSAEIFYGKLGDKLKLPHQTITLRQENTTFLKGKKFTLEFLPKEYLYHKLQAKFSLSEDTETNALIISTKDRDRFFASTLVNTVLHELLQLQKETQEQQVQKRLSYLKKRKEENEKELDLVLKEHQNALKKNIALSGFAQVHEECSFLHQQKVKLQQDFFQKEFELEHTKRGLHTGQWLPLKLEEKNSEMISLENSYERMHKLLLQTEELQRSNIQERKKQELLERNQERIAILKKQISHHLKRLQNKQKEQKLLIEKQIQENQKNMLSIPEKWLFNEKILLQTESYKETVHQITQLVEQYILSDIFKDKQSELLDFAVPPLDIKKPKFFFLLASIIALSSFISMIGVSSYALLYPMTASLENLEALGFNCLKKETRDQKGILNQILYRIWQAKQARSSCIVNFQGIHNTKLLLDLAKNLSFDEQSVCIISTKDLKLECPSYKHCSFKQLAKDYFSSIENLLSMENQEMMKKMKENYSFILFDCSTNFGSLAHQQLCQISQMNFSCLEGQSLDSVQEFVNISSKGSKDMYFFKT